MVQVAEKAETFREARAACRVIMNRGTLDLISKNQLKKGDVLTVAKIAGIGAAKQTGLLIPLCHPIGLTNIDVQCQIDTENSCVHVGTYASCHGRTGVEMEALTAASIAACTIFDMCKAVDKKMVISDLRVVEKKGGKSGYYIEKD
jgi:molybdenum cofactor biosynthesis protein MoaC